MQRIVTILLLLLVFPISSFADGKIGDWKFADSDDMVHFANTASSDGSVTGIACFKSGGCQAYIITPSSKNCEENASYPMMINSPIGAALLNTRCMAVGTIKILAITEFIARDAFESGGEVGYAIPLENGYFISERFSTKGATAAIRKAAEFSPTNGNSAPPQNQETF